MEEFANFFSLFHWFQLRPGPPSSAYWAFVGMYALGLAGSAAYFFNVRQRYGEHAYRLAVSRRIALAGGLLCAFGLIFVGMRFWEVPYLSLRVWTYTVSMGAVGLGVFLVYYFLRMYPASLRAYDDLQLRQRYLPKPKPKARIATAAKRRKRAR